MHAATTTKQAKRLNATQPKRKKATNRKRKKQAIANGDLREK